MSNIKKNLKKNVDDFNNKMHMHLIAVLMEPYLCNFDQFYNWFLNLYDIFEFYI